MQSSKHIESPQNNLSESEPDRTLPSMCLLAFLAGIIGGVGAWAFRMLIGLVHNILFLSQFAFHYDANLHTPAGPWGPGIILAPVAGGLAVAWLVKNFAPEAKGHGVPEVMDAIYYNQGLIRPRVAIVKSIASAISIGSGCAVGREGPIIQIGSAFGSMLGQIFSMPARQRIILIAAGSGAGIAATFNAPLGGMVFAIELLLVSISAINIFLVAISTVTATYISHLLLGTAPSFYIPVLEMANFTLQQSWSFLLFIVLGVLIGLVSVLFIHALYWSEDKFDALPGNYYTRHALGTLCIGVMMYLLLIFKGHYFVQGVGYATIADILNNTLSDPWFLLLLFILKLMATCFALGSGASGGVFSPVLFMGATVGAAFGQLAIGLFPDLQVGIPAFAIAGMAGGIGGATGAVLTGIIMITEMTRDSNVILPVIIVVSTAYATRKTLMRESIYTLKLLRRGHVVPEGQQAAIMSANTVEEVMSAAYCITPDNPVPDESGTCFTSNNGIIGKVYSQGIPAVPITEKTVAASYILVHPEMTFVDAVRHMHEVQAEMILVSGKPDSRQANEVVGAITHRELAQHLGRQSKLL